MIREPHDSAAATARLLRALIDTLPDAAWILEGDRRLVVANEPYRRLQCLAGGEVTASGEPPACLGQAPEERDAWDACYRRAFAGESFSEELTFGADDGVHTLEVTFQPVRDGDEVPHVAATARDVTLRRRAEEARVAAERRLAAALDGSDVGLWDRDMASGEVTVDRRWLAMVGRSGGDDSVTLSPQLQAGLIHPDDLRRGRERFAAYLKDRTSFFEVELRMRHTDGHWVHVLERGRVTAWDEAGRPLRMSGTHLDVSDLARARETLAESEERFRSLYEAMAQGVVFQDAAGPITAANPAAERILGLSLQQLQGRLSTDPRWRALREDGSDFPGEEHPAMLALRSGQPVHGVQMGVYHPATDVTHWLLVDAVPQFHAGEERPWQVFTVFTDITALRAAEAALRESEDRFKYVFDRSAVGMIIRSPEGRITAVNDALCRMLGYAREELEGSEIGMIVCPEDAAVVRRDMAAVVAGQIAEVHMRRRLRAKDGSPRWGDASFSLRRDAEGGPMYFIVAIVDVTSQVAAAEEIARLNAMRDLAERMAKMGSWALDLETGRMAWSPGFERLLDLKGLDVAGDFGIFFEERVPPEDREGLHELFALALREGSPPDVEHRILHRDGSEHILHVTGTPEPTRPGHHARITGFVRDVTAERHAEQAAAAAARRLAESETTLRAILENAAEGLTMLDLKTGRYVFMSPRYVELTGFTAEEMESLPAEAALERCHPDDRAIVAEYQRRIIAGESDLGAVEYRWRIRSGGYRWFRDSRSVLRDADGTPYALVGVSSDITVRKQLEGELRESLEEHRLLLEMEQAAGEEHRHIASDLHDAVAQNVFSANLIAESLPAVFAQAPEKALDDIILIRRLIRAVFAELRLLLYELRPETLAVDSLDTLLQRLGDALAGKADLVVEIDVDKELVLPPDVRAVFYRVALEAFNNVAKHARATRLSVALKGVGDLVRLEIRDNGRGLDLATCPRGMGIDIMRERAESIGAHLAIESAQGAGTTVTLTWRTPQ